MGRKAQIIGQTADVHGDIWDVRERRPTPHGWHLLIGWPQNAQRGRGGRGVAVVPTQALIEYLNQTRLKDVNLPIGRTAIKRLRSDHSIAWDWDAWWAQRGADLLSMTLEQFSAKYGCSMGAASQRRTALKKRSASDIQHPI